jgi:hypothetical protein
MGLHMSASPNMRRGESMKKFLEMLELIDRSGGVASRIPHLFLGNP